MKRLSLLTFLLTITMASTYKEPSYTVIQKNDNIELRQYSEYVIARTLLTTVILMRIVICLEI